MQLMATFKSLNRDFMRSFTSGKFYWVSDFTTNYVTALHIASFAAFRFTAVRKPFKIWDVPKYKVLMYIVVLWFSSLLIALPLHMFMGVKTTLPSQSEEVRVFER